MPGILSHHSRSNFITNYSFSLFQCFINLILPYFIFILKLVAIILQRIWSSTLLFLTQCVRAHLQNLISCIPLLLCLTIVCISHSVMILAHHFCLQSLQAGAHFSHEWTTGYVLIIPSFIHSITTEHSYEQSIQKKKLILPSINSTK